MNLEEFPFDECLKRSQCALIIAIVSYLADLECIHIRRIDQETDHVVFWIFHPKYSYPEHGTLIKITDDEVWETTQKIKKYALKVLDYYSILGVEVKVSFSLRVEGIL